MYRVVKMGQRYNILRNNQPQYQGLLYADMLSIMMQLFSIATGPDRERLAGSLMFIRYIEEK